ncbi:MAG: hypothetical protein KZY74_20150, partial [Paenibacillaceae bacterium]|nr:hypothetical protein [Paenibacillaceae bacterium]
SYLSLRGNNPAAEAKQQQAAKSGHRHGEQRFITSIIGRKGIASRRKQQRYGDLQTPGKNVKIKNNKEKEGNYSK